MINLSLDRFRRGNYNLEKQQPEMNNSYSDKMVHQLPSTFTVLLYSILLAVKTWVWSGRWMWDQSKFRLDFISYIPSLQCLLHTLTAVFCSKAMNRTFHMQVIVYLTFYRRTTSIASGFLMRSLINPFTPRTHPGLIECMKRLTHWLTRLCDPGWEMGQTRVGSGSISMWKARTRVANNRLGTNLFGCKCGRTIVRLP